ncbi:type II secretion system F family protein [Dactylosporangium sp. CA-092794]|uniref:type II secretion system F family protein n=1 Tax=Dactylosporangium sp. CA-092794 TaxID=3239929 RepID=UPI003D910133
MRALFALFGAGVGIAVLLLAGGLRAPVRPDRPARAERRRARAGVSALRIAGVLAAAALVGAVTRWPVAAALAAVAAWALPAVLGPDRAQRRTLERVEAIAAWAEDLSGTLRAAAGIEQTILQTAAVAPAEIRPELNRLAEALRAAIRLPDALRAFAADLADPTADMVVNVLLQAAQHQARDIATGLSGVGRAARRQASSRLRVATGRSRTRTSTRIVICVVLASVVLLAMFARNFLAPYGSPLGQLILAVLGTMFGGALMWMVRTGRIPDLPRILTRTADEVTS